MYFFLLIGIITIAIMGITNPRCVNNSGNIQITNIAFAQYANNASTIVVPSQTGKTEITLKNSPSNEPDYSLYVQIITAITSAAAAILGGYIASRYAHKKAMEVERSRSEQQKQKETAIEVKQEKQREEYTQKVTAVVYGELTRFSSTLGGLMDKGAWEVSEDYDPSKIMPAVFESSKMEFLKIPFDIRLTLFSPEVLYNVQTAYETYEAFRRMILVLLKQHENNDLINLDEAVKKLAPDLVKQEIDDAIKSLEDLLYGGIDKK